VIRSSFESPEFIEGTLLPLAAGLNPWRKNPDHLDQTTIDWLIRFLPVNASSGVALAGVVNWAGVILLLAEDPRISEIVGGPPIRNAAAFSGLQLAAAYTAEIEGADCHRVWGWYAPARREAVRQPLELWVDYVNLGLVQGNRPRPCLHDRLGGDVYVGFDVDVRGRLAERGQALHCELRIAGSGFVVAEASIARPQLPTTTLVEIRRELATLSQSLRNLEARLPQVDVEHAWPLADYPSFARTWPDVGQAPPVAGLSTLVILDTEGASPSWIEDSLWSLTAGGLAPDRVHPLLLVSETGRAFTADLMRRVQWRSGIVSQSASAEGTSFFDRVNREAEWRSFDVVMVLRAGDVLAPGALADIAEALRKPGVVAVYGDDDAFEPDDAYLDPGQRRRCAPRLKPDFDADLLAQSNYVGEALALRMSWLSEAGDLGADAEARALALLDLDGQRVAHLGRTLVTRWERYGPPSPSWGELVARHLGDRAEVEPHVDSLGAIVPGAVRVHHPIDPTMTATVIILTRDKPELLSQCVASIDAHRTDNQVPVDVIIVDHENSTEAARALLAQLAEREDVRILPYAGPFNWALMNNLAAAEANGTVLVFLNDDTLVLSPGWLDELVSQASRPEIGVVGSRLVYENGTLQHAGMVTREIEHAFIVHEGVGVPGSEAGHLGRHALVHRCTAVTGACLATRANLFRRLGGFDAAHFPVEANDVDYCMRAQEEGLAVLYSPYATLYHLESQSRGFNRTPAQQAVADAANRKLWGRWGARFGHDPYYNARFDRLSPPFARLRPPAGR